MKLAVNYSPHAARLVDQGAIQLDLLKCPDLPGLPERVQAHHPCCVHFRFRAGRGQMDQADWPTVERLMQTTDTPHVSMHLSPCVSDHPGMPLDTDDPAHCAMLTEAMARDVDAVARRVGAQRMVLENVMWDPRPPWQPPQPALEPEVIRKVVTESGCGLLLDVAHACITARHFGLREEDYVAALPVARLREVHVSGTRREPDGLWYDHHPLSDDDWRLTEWVLERVRRGEWPRPALVTLEYGGVGPGFEENTDEAALAEQVPRLWRLVSTIRADAKPGAV